MSNTSTAYDLISLLYKDLGIVLKGCTTGIFIVDPTIKRMYKDKGVSHNVKLGTVHIDLVINPNSNYTRKPCFASLEVLRGSIRKSEYIVSPVFSSKCKSTSNISLILQLENNSVSNDLKHNYEGDYLVFFSLS